MKIYIPIIIALILSSCGSNEVDEGEMVTFTGRIASRVAGIAESADTDNELIGSYHIRFIDVKGTTYSIDRELGRAVESDQFELQIPSGYYRIYAVANQAMPDDPASMTHWDHGDTLTWERGKLIPMTGHLSRTINTSVVTQPFAIEVVRQMAKFTIDIENSTERDVTVNSYSLRRISGISQPYFWPDYGTLGKAPKLPDDYEAGTVERNLGATVAKGESTSDSFYFVESTAAEEEQGVYTIELDLTHADGTNHKTTALLTDINHVNRNDHIVVPLKLTDYMVKMNVLFYPPIGGYPAVVDRNELTDEYVVTFGSQGDFVITPTVHEATTEMKPVNFTNPTVRVIEATAGMFDREPTIDSTTNEILGSLTTKYGRAKLEVSFRVTVGSTAVTVRRQILIIHAE